MGIRSRGTGRVRICPDCGTSWKRSIRALHHLEDVATKRPQFKFAKTQNNSVGTHLRAWRVAQADQMSAPPSVAARASLSPVPSGGPRASVVRERPRTLPRIRVSFGSAAPNPARLMCRTPVEATKNPSGAVGSGGAQIRTDVPLDYKGTPPRAAYVSTPDRLSLPAFDMDCLFKPFIRCSSFHCRADFSAQGTRLLRLRLTGVNRVDQKLLEPMHRRLLCNSGALRCVFLRHDGCGR